jgi:hypothetical protein
VLAPLAALVLLLVLGLRTLQTAARPTEGLLAAEGFSLTGTRAGLPAAVLSPDGLGALHMAVYATSTRAFTRHDTLVAAGRELLLVATLAAAVLLWRTARRLGLGEPAAAVVVVLFGVPALLPPVGLVDSPVRLAVPWLLVAAWLLAPGRPTPTARWLALVATAVAVLLSPDAALLVLGGTAAALGTGALRGGPGRSAHTAGAVAAAAGFAVVLALRGRWDPRPAAAADWDVPVGLLAALAAACVVVGALAAWRVPRLRAAGIAAAATAVTALVPHPRVPALLACLPVAALLAGALLEALPERSGRRPVPAAVAALAVFSTAVAAVLVPTTGQAPDRRGLDALLAWAGDQLPGGGRLVAARPLWAELLHAGGDEQEIRLAGTAGAGSATRPVLTVDEGPVPDDGRLVATFSSPGWTRPFVVSDPHPGVPSDRELARRRSLSAALLANPTTVTGDGAAAVLDAAAVDPRLLSLLAALTANYGIGVGGFPAPPGEPAAPADGVLARQALVTSLGGEPLRPGAAPTNRLLAWLHAQLPPFIPDHVTVTDDGVLIGFRYVSVPDALVTQSTP